MSLRHDLNDADLTVVLDRSWSRTHALSSRARSQLENTLRVLLVTRTGRQACPSLDELLTGWGGQLTAQTRHVAARHIDQCQACADHSRGTLRPEALFDLLPLAAPPLALREQVLRRCAEVTRDSGTRQSRAAARQVVPASGRTHKMGRWPTQPRGCDGRGRCRAVGRGRSRRLVDSPCLAPRPHPRRSGKRRDVSGRQHSSDR